MNQLFKLENASALIASASAVALGAGLLFMLGYTWPFATKLVSVLSYRDFLVLIAQSFVAFVVPALFGVVISEAQQGFKKSRDILDTNRKMGPSGGGGDQDSKFLAAIMSRRFPTITAFFIYLIAIAAAFLFTPKIFMFAVAFAALLGGMFVVLLFFAKEWYFSSGYKFIALATVGLSAFIFGNWTFYRDTFYLTTQIKLHQAVDGIDTFALLRPVDDSYLLFASDSKKVYFVSRDLNAWVRFDSVVCNESELSKLRRIVSQKSSCE